MLEFHSLETELLSFRCGQMLKFKNGYVYKRHVFSSVLWHSSSKALLISVCPLDSVTLIDCKNEL